MNYFAIALPWLFVVAIGLMWRIIGLIADHASNPTRFVEVADPPDPLVVEFEALEQMVKQRDCMHEHVQLEWLDTNRGGTFYVLGVSPRVTKVTCKDCGLTGDATNVTSERNGWSIILGGKQQNYLRDATLLS